MVTESEVVLGTGDIKIKKDAVLVRRPRIRGKGNVTTYTQALEVRAGRRCRDTILSKS